MAYQSFQGRQPEPGASTTAAPTIFNNSVVISTNGSLTCNGDVNAAISQVTTGSVITGTQTNLMLTGPTRVSSATFSTAFPTFPSEDLVTTGGIVTRFLVGSGTPSVTLGTAFSNNASVSGTSTLTDLWGRVNIATTGVGGVANGTGLRVTFSAPLPTAPVAAISYASSGSAAGDWHVAGDMTTTYVQFNAVNGQIFKQNSFSFNYFIFL
jgi:hypothetical protein